MTFKVKDGVQVGSTLVLDSNGYLTTRLATARTISLSGDVSGSASFDGSANISITATVADDSHNHIVSNIDGLQTELDGKLSLTGGTLSNGDNVTLEMRPNDAGQAYLKIGRSLNGSQGTGIVEVTQDGSYGGGFYYNGDGTPAFISGESSDTTTFYRMAGGTKYRVFQYGYDSDTVTFVSRPVFGSATPLDSSNYNSYAPTLTGGGASGSWGINITGTAGGETLATVTSRGASTGTSVTLSSGGNQYNGHLYYLAYDSSGNHYPHFNDGGSASGSKVNWRLFTGGSNSITHYWDTATTLFNTKLESSSRVDAPIFYDRNNTGYYIDPASTDYSARLAGNIYFTSYAKIGIEDAGLDCYLQFTDENPTVDGVAYGGEFKFHGDKSISASYLNFGGAVVENTLRANGSLRAPIFYDSNDTGYYFDGASTSVINNMNVAGTIQHTGGNGAIRLYGNLHIDAYNGQDIYLNYYGARRTRAYVGTSEKFRVDTDGIVYAYDQFRTPIVYDTNNTGYYVDPASTSRLSILHATYCMASDRTTFTVGGNASTYYPVIFQIGGGSTSYQYCSFIIERGGYDNPGYAGIGFSNMHAKFSMTSSGWGFGSDYIAMDHYKGTYNAIAKWMQEYQTSRFIVWLRGATQYNLLNVIGNTTLVDGNSSGTNITSSYNTFSTTTTVDAYATYTRMNDGNLYQSGEITSTGNITAYYSDIRLKDVIGKIENPIEKVKMLTGFYYKGNETAKSLGYNSDHVEVGVSAQDVLSVLPEIVKPAPVDQNYYTLDYSKLVPLLIEVVKNQEERIEELYKVINEMKNST